MTTLFRLLSIATFYLLQTAETKTFYVSPVGTDQNSCSNGSCGTLYAASTLASDIGDKIIINGQNEMEINTIYLNNGNDGYHPCFPKTFNNDIEIEFNCMNMSCWYPSICSNIDNNNNTQYINKYMFHTTNGSLTINNLHIDYHKNNIMFGIMGMENIDRESPATLSCADCVFQNIHNYNNDIYMIYSARNIKITNSLFVDIKSVNHFIVMEYGKFYLSNVSADTSTFDQSFITVLKSFQNRLFRNNQNSITLNNCQFRNIYSKLSLINDEWWSCTVSVHHVNFTNIEYGSIWRGDYEYGSSVDMTNIFISTSQLLHDDNALLYFNFAT
eukprot:402692_1